MIPGYFVSYGYYLNDLKISIGQEFIRPTQSCKSLGVIFDRNFNMEDQINNVSSGMLFHIRNIKAIRSLHTPNRSNRAAHALTGFLSFGLLQRFTIQPPCLSAIKTSKDSEYCGQRLLNGTEYLLK